MKKITKYLLTLCVTAVFLTGCKNEPAIEKENENKWGRDPVDLSSAKTTDLVKINIKDAKGFGTIWGGNAATTKAQARAAAGENNGSNTLITFKADGSTDYALTKPEGLASWCEYQPVREVYQCPYTNVEKQAKGIYVVFSSYIDFWEDEAGNKLSPIGQLIYVKPDGTVIDVFASINKVKTVLDTTIKENDDCDYIKFDEQGNIYMIVKDEGLSKICRYNPQNNGVTFYKIPGKKIYPLNFEVTSNGAYIILNTLVNYEGRKNITVVGGKGVGEETSVIETGRNYVYAIPVNSAAEPKILYESKAENGGREILNVCYDSSTNTVYFGVECHYASYVGSGIHIWNWNKTKGEFDKERIFINPQGYMWADKKEKRDVNYVSVYKKSIENPDKEKGAQEFLDYLKSFYGANADKVHFTLDFWRNYKDAKNWSDDNKADYELEPLNIDDIENTTKYLFWGCWSPYEHLYKEGEDGKVLTEVAAMRYLLETKNSLSELLMKNSNDPYVRKDYETYKDLSIWELDIDGILSNWGIHCWNMKIHEDGSAEYNTMGTRLWLFFTTAEDGTWSPETAAYPGYYDLNDADERDDAKKWCFESSNDYGAYLITNDDGVWAIHDGCDNWDLTGWQEDYAQVTRVFKADGRFTLDTPASVNAVSVYKLPHLWPEGDVRNRIDSDPWYKAPFKSFTDGFLLKDRNNNTIWYYNCTNDSCSKIFDDSSLCIYSYSLNNGVLTVNGNTDLGYNRTVKVMISTGAQTEIESDAKFETLINVNIPTE